MVAAFVEIAAHLQSVQARNIVTDKAGDRDYCRKVPLALTQPLLESRFS